MLRKAISFIIIITIFLGVMTPLGYSQAKSSILTKAEAEKLVRERLSVGKDYTLEYSNLNINDIQQRQFWNLNFEGKDKYISVVVTADSGEINSVNSRNYENSRGAINLLQDEAKEIAIDYIKSLEEERFKETEEVTAKVPTIIPYDLYSNTQYGDNYYFMFVRKIKEEFFPSNYFIISVSGISGNVESYEMKWDIGTYEESKEILTEEQVRDIFIKENRLKLKYISLSKYNAEEEKNIILTPVYIYEPKETDKIDAVTGRLLSLNEIYSWDYYGNRFYTNEDIMVQGEMVDKESLNQAPEMIPEDGVISKEKIEQIVLNKIKDYVDIKEIKLKNTRYTNNYNGTKGKFWFMNWHSDEGNKYLNAVINAENGEMLEISYNNNEDYEPIEEIKTLETSKNSSENIEDKENLLRFAKEKIETLFPKTEEGLKLDIQNDRSENKKQTHISSSRYIDDIPFENNYVRVSFNNTTQEIVRFNYKWSDVEVQKSGPILSDEDIQVIFYNKVGFENYLVQLTDLDRLHKDGLELPIEDLLLVYGIKDFDFKYVNGITGKFLDYAGEEFKEEKKDVNEFKDIKGNIYEKHILLMNKMGILKMEEEFFKPEEILLRKDALKWIVEIGWTNKAYGMNRYYNRSSKGKENFKDISEDSPYYKYIEVAVEYGIIDKEDYFKPEEEISKIELTKWIINAMKHKELAKYSSIFQSPYMDKEIMNVEDIGYIALAKYYDIFGDKNYEIKFEPNKTLNRDEFIHHMYNLIREYDNNNY